MTATAGMLGEATPDDRGPPDRPAARSRSWSGSRCTGWASRRSTPRWACSSRTASSSTTSCPRSNVGTTLFLVGIGGSIVGIIVQPTVGYISDFTVSRWGRRKPYIVFGSLLDVVFLLGIATATTVLALAAFVILLSFSTNIARGPFQGYVPDLVAEPQVGLASGLVGMMQIVGNVTGYRARVAVRRVRPDGAQPVRGRDRRARHDAQRHPAGRQGPAAASRAKAGRGRGSPARPGRPTSSRSGRTCGCSSRACCS